MSTQPSYGVVPLKSFGRPGSFVFDKIKEKLKIKPISENDMSILIAIERKDVVSFSEAFGDYLDKNFENRSHILKMGKEERGVSLIKLGDGSRTVSGLYRAVSQILEGFLGQVELKGSVLVGVGAYWERLVSEGSSKVGVALGSVMAVSLEKVFVEAVRWCAVGGGGGTEMQVRRGVAIAEEGEESAEEEVVEDDRKGKGRKEDDLGVMEGATTRAMARMRMEGSGAAAELEEEEREEGSSEEDAEEVGWVGKARGRARFCLLRFDGRDPGLPSETMMKFIRQEQACEAVVVLGFRTMEEFGEKVKNAWLGIEKVIVVERKEDRLYFDGKYQRSLEVEGDVFFFSKTTL